jgi:hypothetical protein
MSDTLEITGGWQAVEKCDRMRLSAPWRSATVSQQPLISGELKGARPFFNSL